MPRGGFLRLLFPLLAVFLLLSFCRGESLPGEEISYAKFREYLAAGQVKSANIATESIHGRIERSAGDAFDYYVFRVDDDSLVEELERHGVDYTGVRTDPMGSGFLLLWLLPLLLFPLLLLLLARARSGGPGGPMGSALGFGRSRARLVADRDTGVTFADVAGCDEAKADLAEVVQFLKQPERFTRLGARVPKGVLLLGPPGTGKTLLARAVAGEAGVPFYSISGSEFVEMFVGVGAARVRDLFETAKRNAPCIVFIDEIDAIGRARGVHMVQSNDEREQTLNQLLVELDGFEPNSGVIVLAATNRPDVLDVALLRPGRFDRQVVLDAPDLNGRVAILKVHVRGKPLADDVDLTSVARSTPGFSGADLANAINEAALLASRRGADSISQHDIEEAVEKIIAGPERGSRRLREVERRRVATHEAGHAVVAFYSEHADPVHKISIVPRGRAALGYTMQLPIEEQHVMTRSELIDRVVGLLGGRCAEEFVFGEPSTGAADDLERATALVRQMVALWGMGESAGLMRCATDPGGMFLRGQDGRLQRDCSEATAEAIDAEVRSLLEEAHGRALEILRAHPDGLERVVEALLERERLDRAEFEALLRDADAPA